MRAKFTRHSSDACSIRYQDRWTDLLEDRTFVRRGRYVVQIGLNGIDGDNTDLRHIEPSNVIVSLYAKGKAKRDTGGFVQIKGVHYE